MSIALHRSSEAIRAHEVGNKGPSHPIRPPDRLIPPGRERSAANGAGRQGRAGEGGPTRPHTSADHARDLLGQLVLDLHVPGHLGNVDHQEQVR